MKKLYKIHIKLLADLAYNVEKDPTALLLGEKAIEELEHDYNINSDIYSYLHLKTIMCIQIMKQSYELSDRFTEYETIFIKWLKTNENVINEAKEVINHDFSRF